MHQLINKKKNKYYYLLILLFISSLNNYNFQIFKNNLFKIKTINIKGINKNIDNEIKNKLIFLKNENLFLLKKKKVTEEMEKFNYVDSYSIFKKYPSELIVKFNLTTIVGKTYKNNKKYFVGKNSRLIDYSKFKDNKDLPFIFGNFEISEFIIFLNLLENNNFNIKDINEFYYFESKRWDIIIENDLLIKFPRSNLDNSIQIAKKIIENKSEIKKVIDLRVSNQVIIRNE